MRVSIRLPAPSSSHSPAGGADFCALSVLFGAWAGTGQTPWGGARREAEGEDPQPRRHPAGPLLDAGEHTATRAVIVAFSGWGSGLG
jgi:hypothetical protein